MKEFAVLCSRRGLDAADYWAQFAQEGGEDLDPESAMLAKARHQVSDLDVIAGYAASLKTASLGRRPDDAGDMVARLRAAATSGTPTDKHEDHQLRLDY